MAIYEVTMRGGPMDGQLLAFPEAGFVYCNTIDPSAMVISHDSQPILREHRYEIVGNEAIYRGQVPVGTATAEHRAKYPLSVAGSKR